MLELHGKVALVTGAGPNIGVAIARRLAAAGARVACNDVDAERAEAAAAAIRADGGDAIAVPGDITDPQAVAAFVQRTVDVYGGIDILVNNAAITVPKSLLTISYEEWCRNTDIILNGTFLVSQAVAKQMVAQGRGGAIVNIASTSGHRGRANAIAYCTAKGGILNLTRAMACDLAPYRIRVNSVSPTKTGASVGGLESAGARDTREILLGRLGHPEDQAAAVLFLVSDAAAFITGEDLRVDGGSLATWGTRSQRFEEPSSRTV